VYASLGGLPAVSVPFGKSADGMPLAVQLTAAPFMEGLLLGGVKILEEGEA
jgi:aspartyl-tRNA(Asn)/glutamyl-tRNA(Gln) amidotransferase subunit A